MVGLILFQVLPLPSNVVEWIRGGVSSSDVGIVSTISVAPYKLVHFFVCLTLLECFLSGICYLPETRGYEAFIAGLVSPRRI